MKEQIDLLVELQEKDKALCALRWQVREGPERLREFEKEFEDLEQDARSDKERIQDLKKDQRQYEAKIEDGLADIRKSRGRLMSIKHNKEYQALSKEIEEAEKANTDYDDKILICMEELEGLNKEVAARKQDLSAMRERLEKEKIAATKELARVHEELSNIEKTRDNLRRSHRRLVRPIKPVHQIHF